MSIGVPIKVLHEAEGHIVTCETNTGEVYRGKLIEAEDNMNCQVPCSARGWGGPGAGAGLEGGMRAAGRSLEFLVSGCSPSAQAVPGPVGDTREAGFGEGHLEVENV
ncbi:PREDICTED: small nuclear ribonucleoprotein Sm D3 [Bison bison bison]|uniref:Small nuclear ribonucleoprotein Sm D3 n=1 Tax=Bison bison bison TaxID=43346 RepID=A0A6P3HLM1_BISBB|nr:PREDICTED: small nuclear ribonucleoprotein Sm D3 [Bison bison bison]